MKYVAVILSGGASCKDPALAGGTPLAAARIPRLDALARCGRVGAVKIDAGRTASSPDLALLALLGYRPAEHNLRLGALEAIGSGLTLAQDDLVLHGSFVSLYNECIVDPTAGRISGDEAAVLLGDLHTAIADPSIRLHALRGHRFLVIVGGGREFRVETVAPQVAARQAVRELYPHGSDAGRLGRLLDQARRVLADHDINRVRVDLGENPANFVWLWGAGGKGALPWFRDVHRVGGAAVTGAPLGKGVARLTGLELSPLDGATGDIDTDLAAKARQATSMLDVHDLVVVQVQALNEASELRDPQPKIDAIERIDRELIAPLHDHLLGRSRWRMLVAADPAPSALQHPLADQAAVLIAGSDISAIRGYPFDEAHALQSEFQIDDGRSLMEFFLGGRPRRSG